MTDRVPHVDDRVRLLQSVPDTELLRGQVGVVCSTWNGLSIPFFEVEFVSPARDDVSRQLLTLEQIAIDEAMESSSTFSK